MLTEKLREWVNSVVKTSKESSLRSDPKKLDPKRRSGGVISTGAKKP